MKNVKGLFLMMGLLGASVAPARGQAAPSWQEELRAETVQIQSLWKEKQIAEAVRILQKRAASSNFTTIDVGTRVGVYYNLACGSALLGRSSGETLAYLGMAVGEGFKDFANMKADSDLDSLRKEPGFLLLLDMVRSRGDYPWVLRQHAGYRPSSPAKAMRFTYQPKGDPDLIRLRTTWKLEEVAGNGDDTSRLLNLLHWVHAQVRYDGSSSNPEPRNAMSLLEVCKKEGRGINCRMMATVLNEACLALGYQARHITCLPLDEKDPDCHVITAVWVEGRGKWVYLDPTFNGYFTDSKGNLLSIAEVRAGIISGESLNVSDDLNSNGQKKASEEYLNYMAKNLLRLQCPQESAFGYESRKGDRFYVELDPLTVPSKGEKGTIYTHDSVAFWARP